MNTNISHLAQLHFVAEQTARHARIWNGQDCAPPCADFAGGWAGVTPMLRGMYTQRVEYLASLEVQGEALEDYEGFVKGLYEHCYAGMDPLRVEMTSCVGFAEFKSLVDRSGATDTIMFDAPEDDDDDDLLYVSGRSVRVKKEQVEPSFDNDDMLVSPGPSEFLKAEKLETERFPEDISNIPEYSAVPETEMLDDPFYEEADLVEGLAMDYDLQDREDPKIAVLEAAVGTGTNALDKLQEVMEGYGKLATDTEWMTECERMRRYAQTEKVIIGVVGTTGAGKSSLINAILDENNLVATDCMRASTAVATEISYNHGDSKYRAEVEFIRRREWQQELEILSAEIQDYYEIVRRGEAPTDSHAAVALEKIKAVYPALTPQNILDASVDDLMGNEKVCELLDTTMHFEEDDPNIFAEKFETGPDEQAHSTDGLDLTDHGIGLWPLVRVVRIYTKAAALKTGAILVDLPGVFDSNAARVAVANDYMKRCSSHWIVAPINRAVDDKVARDLLSRNFRRQMQMDSAFNDITFICTKTDDIATAEVIQALELELPAMGELREHRHECRLLKGEIRKLQQGSTRLVAKVDRMEPKIEELEERLTGEFLFTPSQLSPKKKPPVSEGRLPLGQRLLHNFHDLQSQRKQLQNERRSLHQQIDAKEKQLQELIMVRESQEHDRLRTCIEARNNYSKEEMKRDFVHGIWIMDQEINEDGSTRTKTRDYRTVEKSLPIFCVSSRAYQELRGRCERRSKVRGYARLEETEIPQLQRHCIALTEKARESSARRFLVHLHQLFQSMSLWTSVTNAADTVSDSKRLEIEADFNNAFGNLEKGMRELGKGFNSDLEKIFRENVTNDLDRAACWATLQFPQTVSRWNGPEKDGGLHWQTYRATCRRYGVFRDKDMNKELAEPMLDKIVGGWIRAFEILIPQAFLELTETMDRTLCVFHKDAIDPQKDSLANEAKIMLDGTVRAYQKSIRQLLKQPQSNLKAQQKENSRMISDVIATELSRVYEECVAQAGKGTLARMRDIMKQQAKVNGSDVFQKSAQGLEKELLGLVKETGENITEIIRTLLGWASRDYRGALVEPQIRRFSEQQVRMRREMNEVIEHTEAELQLEQLL
ncbi:uncharacterized protein BO80DRAFT_465201 [Aspergillus ibericus CBS 121593]|uniref:Uncharacterized protein n=1 Tax=Aspergillus ibericus CBS 121593 TaxID=1448316 RepID=A0A395H1K7_9EURO|nr:hypothetical protein BO80DRAFT_465201 [Aspergillus ibericus CBS 121593]RAL00728.1 hypothetical protein BO80DRAFT_465201 [Aspergillus ibericus CBS 121593]